MENIRTKDETWMNIIYESTGEYIELKDETWMYIIYESTGEYLELDRTEHNFMLEPASRKL